ncbi:MAG: NUDIX hydrolase [Proteobacteria bacterium]|nr:NUDIX hydrolase [Pseudomonadota bacterium]
MSKNDNAPARHKLLHKGRLISLYRDEVHLPDGRITHYDIVRHPGGAVIVAINAKQQICLLRQFRHAVDDNIWELPAGCLEPDESPLQTAKRELTEETGFSADTWLELGSIIPSPGFCNEVLWIFKAENLSEQKSATDPDEFLEPHWFSIEQIQSMIMAGEIRDAKTLAAMTLLDVST